MVDQLTPQAQLPSDPNAVWPMIQALGKGLFPYLQQAQGPASFQPNAVGKIPEVDPLAGPTPYAQGAVDIASWLPSGLPVKGLASAIIHLLPMERRIIEAGPTAGQELGRYVLANEQKLPIGEMNTLMNKESKDLYIPWVGLHGSEDPMNTLEDFQNVIGPADVRSVLRALMKEYPEAETISGSRMTGAREKSGSTGLTRIPLKKSKTE